MNDWCFVSFWLTELFSFSLVIVYQFIRSMFGYGHTFVMNHIDGNMKLYVLRIGWLELIVTGKHKPEKRKLLNLYFNKKYYRFASV